MLREVLLATGNIHRTAYNAFAVFYEVPATNLTSVAANAFTTGFDASVFGWTWASQYDELSNIGL
ncbi:MAG: hypothetical protein R2777_03120 [Chitinophagales bacterium]